MFSQFGKILDVVCLKTYRLRGQAWIVFADVAAATNALRTMQGFLFFDKPIVSAPARPQAVVTGAAARQHTALKAAAPQQPERQQQCQEPPAAPFIFPPSTAVHWVCKTSPMLPTNSRVVAQQ
jgi:U2 small nuclear ribonucleoprotein B''